jgi:glycosyltransferase involved in cell wall biosynthesis
MGATPHRRGGGGGTGMRVTMLIRCLAMMRGGGETRHLAWIRELSGLGVEVDVITGQPLLFGGARYPIADVPVTMIRSPYLRDAVYRWQQTRGLGRVTTTALHMDEEWFCRDAWRAIAKRRTLPDVVHAHAVHQTARLRRKDIPVVINLPGAPHARYHGDLRQADALVADGWAADHLPAVLGRTVERVPKGVDADRFSPAGANLRYEAGLRDKLVIVAVGRLVPIKNMRLLIEVMPAIVAAVPRAHALIVGEGPERSMLHRRAEELGVANCVSFAGYVANEDLSLYYRSAEVFALTSEFDNSPNVVLEAMACGLPVVCTDVGGVREFVEPEGGSLVPAGSRAHLIELLVRWLGSSDRRAAAGRHNRRVVLEKYSWRASALRLLDVYRRVIDQRGSRVRQVPA